MINTKKIEIHIAKASLTNGTPFTVVYNCTLKFT